MFNLAQILGGKLGKAIDVIGRAVPQPVKQVLNFASIPGQIFGNLIGKPIPNDFYTQDRGASERLETRGGTAAQQAGYLTPQQAQQKSQQRQQQRGGSVQGVSTQQYGPFLEEILPQRNGGNSGGGGGGGSYQAPQLTPEQIADQALSAAFGEIQSQFGQYLNDASAGDPFAFDEALARNSAVQQYAPYYAQTLQQFLRGVNNKRVRSEQDASSLLEELQSGGEYFTGRAKKLLDIAQEQTREGFSDRGLLFSGQRGRAEGLLAVDRNREIQNYVQGQQRKAESVQEQRRRVLEDLALEKVQGERSIAKSQETDVASAIEDARRRAQSGASYLEALGPAPGQSFGDFLQQRQSILQGFV